MRRIIYYQEPVNVLWELAKEQPTFLVDEIGAPEPKPMFDLVKRSFDVLASVLALIVLLLPMLLIALTICVESPGSPIYVQTRLGKDERPFPILKFRTMCCDAENNGAQWASDNDSRVTKTGRFLRRTRLDELPQFVNIIRGEMSLVGPRPERPEFYEVFDTYIIGFRQRMLVKPGLTGHAQVNGGYSLLPEEKILYDVEYIKNRSVKMDLQCIFRTVQVMFFGEGAR